MTKPLALIALALLAAAGPALPIQPGKWQSTVTITDMQMPGGPPGIGAAMRAHPTTVSACVTAAQAADGPRAVLAASNGKCRYTSFDAGGGRFTATMMCTFASGSMTTTSTGRYTPTMLDVSGSAVMQGRTRMTTTSHTVGRRVGPC